MRRSDPHDNSVPSTHVNNAVPNDTCIHQRAVLAMRRPSPVSNFRSLGVLGSNLRREFKKNGCLRRVEVTPANGISGHVDQKCRRRNRRRV
ncbi:hypothetical protein BaRGS_00008782 [Batillaria attramentaria]|uniref:Ribosomal protein S11 n=1 Tax=Batillaria attramentaria TaxID=370345 RepID=A0ABD0LK83_9CAEN